MLRIRIRDPESAIWCFFSSWIRILDKFLPNPGSESWVKLLAQIFLYLFEKKYGNIQFCETEG